VFQHFSSLDMQGMRREGKRMRGLGKHEINYKLQNSLNEWKEVMLNINLFSVRLSFALYSSSFSSQSCLKPSAVISFNAAIISASCSSTVIKSTTYRRSEN